MAKCNDDLSVSELYEQAQEDRDRNADTIYRIGEEIDRIRKNMEERDR